MATTTTRTSANPESPAKITHPLYADLLPIWKKLAHVREGIGGFLDGTYLIAHPREWEDHTSTNPVKPTKKLKARRLLACYENFAAAIIDSKKSALFREAPTRRIGDATVKDAAPTELETWWKSVDGNGTHIDDCLAQAWDPAATFGHIVLYMDRPKGAAPLTAADQQLPILRAYTPIDLIDWSTDDNGQLTEVLFQEAVPRKVGAAQAADYRTRYVNAVYWEVRDKSGNVIDGGPQNGQHQFGILPVVPLYAQRRPLLPFVGQSVVGDPQLHIDLYNLLSETRELLRAQTFSILNVPLGSGDQAMSVDDAVKLIGSKTGTDNVLFSGLAAGFIAADAKNVEVYQKEIERRLRAIYRLAAVAWESDSRDAEAEGSMKLKREDMNQRLADYADEVEKTDYKIAELFYRSQHGAEGWEAAMRKDPVLIRYPDNFDVTPFDQVLQQAQAAMNLGMPPEFMKELRKRLVTKFLPDALPETVDIINKAIDAAEADPTPAERAKMRIDAAVKGKAA